MKFLHLFSLALVLSLSLLAAKSEAAPQFQLKKRIHLHFKSVVNDVAFSPDGLLLYAATSKGIFLRQTQTGRPLPTFSLPPGWSYVNYVVVSPNGRYLAAIARKSQEENRLFIWNLTTRKLEIVIRGNDIGAIAFSPHEHWLAVSEDSTDTSQVRLVEVGTWKTRRELTSGGIAPYMLAFSPNGELLAATSFYGDAAIGDLTLWNANTGQELWYDDETTEGPLYFLPGGRQIVLGPNIVDVKPKNERHKSKAEIPLFPAHTTAFRWIAAPYTRQSFLFFVKKPLHQGEEGVEGLELWDIARKKQLMQVPVHFQNYQQYTTSPDGRWLVVGYTDIYEVIR